MSPVEELVRRYRCSMTTRCECGEEGCPGELVPAAHDPRVTAMVLSAAVLVMQDLIDAGRVEKILALIHDCAAYTKQCSQKFDDREYGLSEIDTERMIAGFFSGAGP